METTRLSKMPGLAAVALHAIVRDGRAMDGGCDERALDALTLCALRDVPEFTADYFGLSGPANLTVRQGLQGQPDIVILDSAQTHPNEAKVLLEIKGLEAKANFVERLSAHPPGTENIGALDVYAHHANEDADCYVLMPRRKAARTRNKPGAPNDARSKGQRWLIRPDYFHDSAAAGRWTVTFYEEFVDAMEPYLKRTASISGPDFSLIASLLRIEGHPQ